MVPRPAVIATSSEHLHALVQQEMASQGNAADLNHIDVSCIEDMERMFQQSPFIGDISQWDVSRVTYMDNMFEASLFSGDISRWNVSSVTSMFEMFRCSSFQGNVSAWNTSHVVSMGSMFEGATGLPVGLEQWDVSKVDAFFRMFKKCAQTPELPHWLPSTDADVEALLDRSVLPKMSNPTFYHWYRVLGDHAGNMPDHLSATPRGMDCLRPEWVAHFEAIAPIAQGLGLSDLACAKFMQEQWMQHQQPHPSGDVWCLPELGD